MPNYQKTMLTLPVEVADQFTSARVEMDPELRDQYIVELRGQGWTLQSIANAAGLTRERVRQIAAVEVLSGAATGLPTPPPPLHAEKPKPIYIEPKPATLARMLELQEDAQRVRANSPKFREEAEEYTALINESYTVDHVTLYRLAKRLGVTHGALRFRLARYGYLTPKDGTSKVYTPILSANRAIS